jgi:hypothetical protein
MHTESVFISTQWRELCYTLNRQYLTVAADKDFEVPEAENVLLMDLSPVKAKQILNEIIEADDGRVFFTVHAERRMTERKISRKQILCCLKNGRFVEEPYREPGGGWKMKLDSVSAGDIVTVVAALDYDDGRNITIIITTY